MGNGGGNPINKSDGVGGSIPDAVHAKVGDGVDGLGDGVDGVDGQVGHGVDGLWNNIHTRHGGVYTTKLS